VHNRLGVLLATRRKEYQRATDHLIRAVELDPENAVFRNNLGKVLGLEDAGVDGSGASDKLKGIVARFKKRMF
jgi:hypothetical protein